MKIQTIYTMKYFAAINTNEIMKTSGEWIELEKKIILGEEAQTETNFACFLSYTDAIF